MNNKITYVVATILLIILFVTAFTSSLGDSTTMDELAHIPAGYSYLIRKDFRINPEHPPLVKDLAALPLLCLGLNFPSENHPAWKGINEQWWLGAEFLYHAGNNIEEILFWSRLPMILILVFLGFFLFMWTKELGGNIAGLLVLTIFSFSPTFIAHGRLVTTDVAAALGVVMGSYFWIRFLKNPSWKNILWTGIIFGIVMLFKFSLILLVPFFGIITIIFAFLKTKSKKPRETIMEIARYTVLALIVMAIGVTFIIWPVYKLHILNYPPSKQLSDTEYILSSSPMPTMKNICIWMAKNPLLRPLAHYLLGLLMATQRTAAGNTVYFLGMISASGWRYYFPVVYLLKVPLGFHILTLIALCWIAYLIKKPFWEKPLFRIENWIQSHFSEFSMIIFILIYWTTSVAGHLNIGVRHILPSFPFIFMLVSLAIVYLINTIPQPKRKYVWSIILILLGWIIVSSLSAWPYYISYFNEIGGGIKNGYKYVVDSNYDWGQDMKRLKIWLEKNKINKIYVDYFGGSDAKYYLGDKYRKWEGTTNPDQFPKGNYLAVSATLLQGGRGFPVHGFNQPTGYYRWLDKYKPIARAGTSIFIYYIK
ncbi:glycosyltransferase family 39 protein [bacterium]|nr:glycosyltransferase family 39 protein [bacterium]